MQTRCMVANNVHHQSRWRMLLSEQLFTREDEISAFYRKMLAQRLRDRGYKLDYENGVEIKEEISGSLKESA